jgi:hypothetical protein
MERVALDKDASVRDEWKATTFNPRTLAIRASFDLCEPDVCS